MPVPLIIGGLAAAGSLYGVKKVKEGYDDNKEAKAICEEAQSIFEKARSSLEQQRLVTNRALRLLGRTRIKIWSREMRDFVDIFDRFMNLDYKKRLATDGSCSSREEKLQEITEASLSAAELVQGGLGSLSAAALSGVAAYGGAGALATAGTGTAISSLSGAAATNATLAWFGGGPLAAGGLGMTGGTIVLGGIVIAPAILVAGFVFSGKAKENLAKAQETYAEAQQRVVEFGIAQDVLKELGNLAFDYDELLLAMARRLRFYIRELTKIHNRYAVGYIKVDFYELLDREQGIVHEAWEFVQILNKLLKQSLLTGDGKIVPEAVELFENNEYYIDE